MYIEQCLKMCYRNLTTEFNTDTEWKMLIVSMQKMINSCLNKKITIAKYIHFNVKIDFFFIGFILRMDILEVTNKKLIFMKIFY